MASSLKEAFASKEVDLFQYFNNQNIKFNPAHTAEAHKIAFITMTKYEFKSNDTCQIPTLIQPDTGDDKSMTKAAAKTYARLRNEGFSHSEAMYKVRLAFNAPIYHKEF